VISLRTAESAGSNRDVGLTADCDAPDYPMALRFLSFSILNRQSILDLVEPHISSRFVSDVCCPRPFCRIFPSRRVFYTPDALLSGLFVECQGECIESCHTCIDAEDLVLREPGSGQVAAEIPLTIRLAGQPDLLP